MSGDELLLIRKKLEGPILQPAKIYNRFLYLMAGYFTLEKDHEVVLTPNIRLPAKEKITPMSLFNVATPEEPNLSHDQKEDCMRTLEDILFVG